MYFFFFFSLFPPFSFGFFFFFFLYNYLVYSSHFVLVLLGWWCAKAGGLHFFTSPTKTRAKQATHFLSCRRVHEVSAVPARRRESEARPGTRWVAASRGGSLNPTTRGGYTLGGAASSADGFRSLLLSSLSLVISASQLSRERAPFLLCTVKRSCNERFRAMGRGL